jgi:hypothetical protein
MPQIIIGVLKLIEPFLKIRSEIHLTRGVGADVTLKGNISVRTEPFL